MSSLDSWAAQAEAVERKNDELNREQWRLLRDHVHTNTKETATLKQDIEAVKVLLSKLQTDSKEFENGITNQLEKSLDVLKKDHEEEKSQRNSKFTSVDRQLLAIIDRLDDRDVADQSARQKIELSFASAKKEGKELVDAAIDRIVTLEAAVDTHIPSAMNDLKGANQKLRDALMEHVDALKEMQEVHKAAAADALSLERTARDDAIRELQTSVSRRLQEEKAANETRRNVLVEMFESGMAAEKEDRDTAIKNISESMNIERTKRKEADKALEDMLEKSLEEERCLRNGAHNDLNVALGREKTARDAHRTATQAMLDEERAAREKHMKDMHALHNELRDSHREHLEQELSKEQNARESGLSHVKDLLNGYHNHFGNLLERESADRSAHLNDKITEEAAAREKMFHDMLNKFRSEGDAVLQEKIDAEAATREASVAALKDMIEEETSSRKDDIAELEDIIGAERKHREDHHSNFDQKLKEHRDELQNHHAGLHARLDSESAERRAHHEAHHEHMKGLLKGEGDARGEHHSTVMNEIEDLKAQLSEEAATRDAATAELRKALSLLEDTVGDGNEFEASDTARWSKVGSRGAPAPATREMMPLSKRFQSLESKILRDIEREAAARTSHRDEMQGLILAESRKREENHGSLAELLETLQGRHGDLHGLLEKERGERAAHLDSHSKERDAMHSALQDKLSDLHRMHDEHRNIHMTFKDAMNQKVADEIVKLEDLVASECSAILEATKAMKEDLETVKRDMLDGLEREGALRDSNDANLREALSRRMEYLEAVLDGAEDTQSNAGGRRSPSVFQSGGSIANGFTKRVVTLQHRLDGLENRLRGDINKEVNTREAERSKLNDLLADESKSRNNLESSVKTRFEKERALTDARIKEDSDIVGRELDALRHSTSKMFSEIDQREKTLEVSIDRESSSLKQILEEERCQRMTANKANERAIVTLTERLSAEEANNETHRQRFELALAGQKKDAKEKHDVAIERVGSVENHVHDVLPGLLTELRDADTKTHQLMKDQFDGMKASQENQRNALLELVASEKAAREASFSDLNNHVGARFAEERSLRDSRENNLNEIINSRLKEEREDREAGHKTVHQAIAAERAKREGQVASLQEACQASVDDHRRDTTAKHNELKSAIEREREAREAHRIAALAHHDEAQKAREAHAKEVSNTFDGHRQEYKAAIERESSVLRAHAKDLHDRLDGEHKAFKGAMDDDIKKREDVIAKLLQQLQDEKKTRETLFSQHKGEHNTALTQELQAIRKELATAVNTMDAKVDANCNDAKDAVGDAVKRINDVEVCLSDKTNGKTLLNVSRELDDLERNVRVEISKEASQRESNDASLRVLIEEEKQARKETEIDFKTALQKEASDRNKAVLDGSRQLKAAIVSKLHLM